MAMAAMQVRAPTGSTSTAPRQIGASVLAPKPVGQQAPAVAPATPGAAPARIPSTPLGGTYVPQQRPAPSMGGYQAALQANTGFVPTAVSNPGYTPQPYKPYQPEQQAPAPRYPSGTPRAERDAVKAERQRVILGAAAKYMPLGGDVPITRGEVGGLQTAENYRAQEQADEDLRRGVDELIRGRGAVGSSPEEQMALEIAMRRAQEGGQFNDEYLDQQRGAIRNRAAVGQQSAERRMLESLAQRGLSDSPMVASDMAQLAQQGAVSTQGQLAEFEQQAATAREEAERAALGQLTGLSESRSGRRQELDELLAGAYLQNERAPVDLSPLQTRPKKPRSAVGERPPREPKKKKKKSEE